MNRTQCKDKRQESHAYEFMETVETEADSCKEMYAGDRYP